jgi:hypothetical protein
MLPLLTSKALEACIILVARLTFIPGAAFVQQYAIFLVALALSCACFCNIFSGM